MTALLGWVMVMLGYAAPVDAGQLERFLDQTVPERLEATGAPGVLVTVSWISLELYWGTPAPGLVQT